MRNLGVQEVVKRSTTRVCAFDTFIKHIMPGDICLIRGKAFLSRAIRFGQALEDSGQPSYFNHAIGFIHKHSTIIESVATIRESPFEKYLNTPLVVFRHSDMTMDRYWEGIKEVEDNLGMVYPAHRIAFHAVDMLFAHWWHCVTGRTWNHHMLSRIATDWPVCSELWAQFILACGLVLGLELGERWQGVNPDHWFDGLFAPGTKYHIVYAGRIVKGAKKVNVVG